MISYEDIKNANETILTTDIKGKKYAEVPQRVKAFRMVYPTGSIETFQTYLDGEIGSRVVGFTTNIYAFIEGERILLASGNAEEKEASTFINKTSFIENCETSSVGRALGFCGFGIDTSISSAEEVQNAMSNQTEEYDPDLDDGEPVTENQLKVLSNLNEKVIENIVNHFGLESINDISKAQAKFTISKMMKKKNEGWLYKSKTNHHQNKRKGV